MDISIIKKRMPQSFPKIVKDTRKQVLQKMEQEQIIKEKDKNTLILDKKRLPKTRVKANLTNRDIAIAKYLSREVLLTKLLTNRLQQISGRPVIVIAVQSTGGVYTYGIKTTKTIKKDNIYFGSSPISIVGYDAYRNWKNNLLNMVSEYNKKYKKPIIMFVDSSSYNNMPGSLVGNATSHTPEASINGILTNTGYKTKVLSYNIGKGITNIPIDPEEKCQ